MTITPLRLNALANLFGQLWALALQLAMVPVYLRWLGLEAYGLIGIQVTLLWAAAVLDVGLSGTVNRELARASVHPASAAQVRDLVRSLESVVWPLALVIGMAGWALSGFLARGWLKPVAMTVDETALALVLMTAAIAAQWPAGFYAGALGGMGRQVLLNALNVVFATLRSVGVLIPLALVESTVSVFFAWQLAIGLLQTATVALAVWRLLPADAAPPRFRRADLARVGSFTGAVAAIGVLSFVLMQADRIVLSTMLSLDEFGHYALAIAIGTAVHRLIVPMQAAVYPRFSQMVAAGRFDDLRRLYHNSTQVVAVLTVPLVAVLATFPIEVVRAWTGDDGVARATGPVMAVLAIGYGLNGLMIVPYALQLAHADTRPTAWTLTLLAAASLPATWFAALAHAGIGAAAVWTLLNCIYVGAAIPWVHRRLLPGATSVWLVRDVLPVTAAAVGVSLLLRVLLPEMPAGLSGLALIVLSFGAVTAAAVLAASHPRALLIQWIARGSGR